MAISALQGFVVTFTSGFLYKLVVRTLSEEELRDPKYEAVMVSYVFTVLGVGTFITGFILGKVRQSYASYTLATFCIHASGFGFLLGMLQYFNRSYALCIVLGALFGYRKK